MTVRTKMPKEDRAKQFMPFAALKGYELALREKEKIVVKRANLSEDKLEELDYKLQSIHPKDMIKVIHYKNEEYIQTIGIVSKIDFNLKYIKIVNEKIDFQNIYNIEEDKVL